MDLVYGAQWPGLLSAALLVVGAMADPLLLVDIRMLGKPKSYSGTKSEWLHWTHVFKAWLGALDINLLDCVEKAEIEAGPIDYNTLRADVQTSPRTLAFILSQVLQGAALQVVMNTPGYNGLVAWRMVCRQEEPISGAAQVNLLSSIMSTRFSGNLPTFVEEAQGLDRAWRASSSYTSGSTPRSSWTP